MSTKPVTLPRWANVGGDIVTPLTGKQDIGWVEGEDPPAPYFNWLFYNLYKWAEYLNDGALSGNHSIAGNLSVTGTIDGATSERETVLHPAAFQFDDNNTNANTLSQLGYRTNVSGASICYAWVGGLKAGDRITYCQVFYNPNGGGTMQPKLRRIQLSTGTVSDVWAGTNDNTGTAIESQNSGALTHDVAAGYAYFIEVLHSGAANRTHGAIVRFTRPAP
jgi:hypothetical protein